MTKGRGSKGRKSVVNQPNNTARVEIENVLADLEMEEDGGHETHLHPADGEAEMRSGMANISKEIRDLKTEIKASFHAFGEDLRWDMKQDLDDLKKGINQEFTKRGRDTAGEARISGSGAKQRSHYLFERTGNPAGKVN